MKDKPITGSINKHNKEMFVSVCRAPMLSIRPFKQKANFYNNFDNNQVTCVFLDGRGFLK